MAAFFRIALVLLMLVVALFLFGVLYALYAGGGDARGLGFVGKIRDEIASNARAPGAHLVDEVDEILSGVQPSVQRRMLRYFNEARNPEDLTRFPQDMRVEFEHAAPVAANEQRILDIDPELYKQEALDIYGNRVPRIDFDPELAGLIITRRPINGYRDLREIFLIDWQRWRRWRPYFDELFPFFGPRIYGHWEELETETGPGIMHAALMRTGKVVMIPSSTSTVIFDPNNTANPISTLLGATTGLTADLFCSGHSFLNDGTLLAMGGGGGSPGAASSIQGWKFDPGSETWDRTATDMNYKRWYPTAMTLDDDRGRVLVASGWMTGTIPAPKMEIYDPVSDSFSPVSAGGFVGEKLFPRTYPGLHLLSDSKTFYAPTGFGHCNQTAQDWTNTEPSGHFDFTSSLTGAWTNTGDNRRAKGMSVPILRQTAPQARILTFGGGELATSGTARSIDVTASSPSWDFAFPMLEKRVHPNAVLLPDGNVFVSGGMEPVSPTPPNGGRSEMYYPDTGAIFEMDDLHHPRHYHSVALLLPSGKVMTAGGALSGGCSLSAERSIEIFSPPYLFRRGHRPKIEMYPDAVRRGESFTVEAMSEHPIDKIVLIRPMAVTHQTDSEQRVLPLIFSETSAGEYRVTAPDGSTPWSVAPRGYYMMFVVDSRGVPSEAKFVRLT